MKRKSWELKLIFLVLVAVFAVFLAVPAIRLLLKSFLGEDGLTGAYYLDVFSGKGFTTALGNSFAVSIVSALVAVGIAFVMAYIIHYTRLPRGFKRFVQAVATLPMSRPPSPTALPSSTPLASRASSPGCWATSSLTSTALAACWWGM